MKTGNEKRGDAGRNGSGGLLCFPFAPGTRALAWTFPAANAEARSYAPSRFGHRRRRRYKPSPVLIFALFLVLSHEVFDEPFEILKYATHSGSSGSP